MAEKALVWLIVNIVQLWKHKVAFALVGGVVVGILGAVIAANPPSLPSSSQNAQARPGLPSQSGVSTTQQNQDQENATAVAQEETATPQGNTGGQAHTVRGRVMSVDAGAGTFVVRQQGGTLVSVVATGTTTFQGIAQNLGSLKVGWFVEVQGDFQADGTFAASDVNASFDE
jgi:hypothetical protein